MQRFLEGYYPPPPTCSSYVNEMLPSEYNCSTLHHYSPVSLQSIKTRQKAHIQLQKLSAQYDPIPPTPHLSLYSFEGDS